ncbi:hypothetical protein AB4Y99_25415, partial [Bosea sp. TAB14]
LITQGVQAALDMISQNVAPQLAALTTQMNDLEDALEDLIGGGVAPNSLQLGGRNPDYYLALANATGTLPVTQVSGVDALVAAAVAGLVNSAPTTLDTLKELSDAIGGDANFATHMAEALGFRLRVDADQSLTAEQKARAFSNLGFAPSDYYTKTQFDTSVGAANTAAANANANANARVSKAGDMMTGDLWITMTYPMVHLTYPGIYHWRIFVNNDGRLIIGNGDDGSVKLAIGVDGSANFGQFGDLNARIENRAYEWAMNGRDQANSTANDRVHRIQFVGYGETGAQAPQFDHPTVCSDAWWNTNTVVRRARTQQMHVPALGGWVNAWVN